MTDDWFSNLLQGRAESTGLLVAFAVGAFSILVIFAEDSVKLYSWAWFALSTAYWLIVSVTFITIRAWAWHALLIEHHSKNNGKNIPAALRENLANDRKNPLVKFSVADFSLGAGKLLKVFIVSAAIALWVMGFVLWVTIAFKEPLSD